MGAKAFSGAEEFLAHKTEFGGGSYLGNWRDDKELDVVLHPKSQILAVWRHQWYRVYEKDGKQVLGFPRFNSMESEEVNLKQHKRNNDGSRKFPPKVCPFALLLEWVREQIDEGRIKWTDKIFEFETSSDIRTIHAGGFTGLFASDDLTDEELKELAKNGIDVQSRGRNDTMQKSLAQLTYVFVILRYDSPEDGLYIAEEKRGLGKAMKRVIGDEIAKYKKTATPDKGDPWKNVYAFRWQYDKDGGWDAYSALACHDDVLPITEEIREALEAELPDLSQFTEYSNVPLLRASFEEHWCHEIVPPWGELFEEAEKLVAGTDAGRLPESFDHGANASSDGDAPAAQGQAEEPIGCDFCQTEMRPDQAKCTGCGAVYDVKTGSVVEKPTDKAVAKAKKKNEGK